MVTRQDVLLLSDFADSVMAMIIDYVDGNPYYRTALAARRSQIHLSLNMFLEKFSDRFPNDRQEDWTFDNLSKSSRELMDIMSAIIQHRAAVVEMMNLDLPDI